MSLCYCVTVRFSLQRNYFTLGFNSATELSSTLLLIRTSNTDFNQGREMSDKTRNEWQKRWLLSPISATHCNGYSHMVRLVGILLNRQFRFGCLFFLRTISVKSGIEPVFLRRSNYTSTFVHIRAARNKTTRKSVRKYKFIKEWALKFFKLF